MADKNDRPPCRSKSVTRLGEVEQQYLAVCRTLRSDTKRLFIVGGDSVSRLQRSSIHRYIAFNNVKPRMAFIAQGVRQLFTRGQLCNRDGYILVDGRCSANLLLRGQQLEAVELLLRLELQLF